MKTPYFTLIDKQTDFVVIEKHEGINFHDEGDVAQGLFNQVKKHLNTPELYPVHRLDKMTSGLIIMAKNVDTAKAFQQLFAQHQVEKYYLALSDQKPKKKQGLIKGDMEKSRRGMWKLLRSTNQPAITQFFSYGFNQSDIKARLYLLKPHSGKTHQLRVAMASIGAPILGDPLYGKTAADRGYLHAFQLSFTLFGRMYHYQSLPTQGQLFENIQLPEATLAPEKLAWPVVK